VQRIYVVTHAEAEHHVQGLVGGWYDSHLTEAGRRDAELVADRLASLIDGPIPLWSSDLRRSMETASPIAERLGTPIRADARLREMSQGDAGGKPQAWLDERFVPAPDDDRLDHVSMPGGESKRTVVTRIYDAMATIVADPSPTKVVVTHGYAMTFVIAAWIAMPVEATGFVNIRSTPGGITLLEEDDVFRNRALRFVDDTSHLGVE
jgi:probable phosphoglycerate mutase